MKLLFTRFPLESALKGGAELQTISLMLGLIERGHEVAFAGSCPALLALCREHGIPTVEWDIGPPPVTKWHAISFFWRKRHMEASLKELMDRFFRDGQGLDAVVMLSLTGKLLLTDIVTKLGVRVFWVEHDRIGNWLRKNPWLPELLRQSRKATTIVVSDLSHKLYRELGWHEEDLVTIPNGIDAKRLEETVQSKPQTHLSKGDLHIGCISRLSEEKGVDLLIEAIAPLANVHLEIIGEGKEANRLEAMVKASNIQDVVTFTKHEDSIAHAYKRMDVLVLPSRDHDPFGLVAAEAMFLGVPVIVTDACGISGYLRNGTDGIVVKANSASALAEAIEAMQDNTTRTLIAAQGKERAKEMFSLSKMIDRYEQVLA